MAVNIVKSTILTNRDARPQIPNPPQIGGRSVSFRGKALTVTSDSAASMYGLFQVRSSDVVTSAKLYNDALSASTACDIGLWETPANGGYSATTGWLTQAGSVVNAKQFFGASIAMTSAAWATELLPVASWETLAKFDQPIWQVLGLASDPGRDYDVVVDITVAVVAGGWIGMEVVVKRP